MQCKQFAKFGYIGRRGGGRLGMEKSRDAPLERRDVELETRKLE